MKRSKKLVLFIVTLVMFVFSIGIVQIEAARRLPDLIVRDIRLQNDCKIEVYLKNIGNVGVPDAAYNLPNAVGVQMYVDGKPWGGLILSGFDPTGKLKTPGGIAKYIWFPNAPNLNLTPGMHSVKVVVDSNKFLTEQNENNNTLTKRLQCGAAGTPMPGPVIRYDIHSVSFFPNSPAALNFNEKVKVKFSYNAPENVFIWARPMTNGNPTPNYAASGSPQYKAGINKPGAGDFTISKGDVTVDAVRFQVRKTQNSPVLFEKTVPVKFTFPKAELTIRYDIHSISFAPNSPAALNFNEKVNVKFRYNAPQDVHIWARPMTNGNPTPNYAASGSPQYTTGINKPGAGDFTISKGAVTVDAVRFQVRKTPNSPVLFEKTVPVKFTFPKLMIATPQLNPGTVQFIAKMPQRVFVDFKDAYLAYKMSTKSIQVIAELNVLTYGDDWDKAQVKPFLFHIKQKNWQGFYWQVNSSKKEVSRITGGTFGQMSGNHQKLNIKVDVSGDFFYLRFSEAYLVYVPSSKSLQVVTLNSVLTYTPGWKNCNASNVIFHLQQDFWQGFYWEINALTKKADRINGGNKCTGGGSKTPLKATVRVVN